MTPTDIIIVLINFNKKIHNGNRKKKKREVFSQGIGKTAMKSQGIDQLSLFKAIVEASSEAIAVSDSEGKIVYINPAHERLFGRTLKQAQNANYRDYYPPESVCILNETVAPALDRGESWEGVLEAYNAEGRPFPLWERADTIRGENGKMLYAFGIMHDVGALLKKEQELREAKYLFEKTIENQQSAILILDARVPPEIIRVNNGFCKIFNYHQSEVLGRKTDFLHVNEGSLKLFQEKLYPDIEKKGFCLLHEFQMKRRDGSIFPTEICVTPLEDEQKKRIGWVSVVRDISEHKRMENALRESELRYRTLFQKNLNPIAVIDRQGRYMDANTAFLEFTGKTRNQLLEMNVFDFSPPEKEKPQKNEHSKVWETGGTLETEYFVEGQIKVLDLTITPIHYQGNDAIVGVGRDVTEHRRAEAALQAEHDRFIAVMDALDAGVYAVDIDSHEILFMNAHVRKKYGDRKGEKCWQVFYPDLTAPCSFCNNDNLRISDGNIPQPFSREFYNSADDRWYHCRYQLIRWPDGRLARVEIAMDITRLKETETALGESRTRLMEAQRLAHIGNWEWDIKRNKLIWSDEVYRIFGVEPGAFKPSSDAFEAIIHPDDREDFLKQRAEMLEKKQFAVIEHRIVLPDGNIRHVQERAQTFDDENGTVDRVIGTVQDITDRKRIEEQKSEFEKQKVKVKKTESMNRIIGAIAHKFNNKLAVIIGNLELVREDLPIGAGLLNNLDEAMQAADQAAQVSSLMLTCLGQSSEKKTRVDISEICRQTLSELHDEKIDGIDLSIQFPAKGPAVHANADQIRQVLINLFNNAVESMKETPVSIRVAIKKVTPAMLSRKNRFPADWIPLDNAYVCLEIADTGCGIPDANMENLFDPFFSTQFTGRGLGLPVSLGIVMSCGGCIAVESRERKGSTFYVLLPIAGTDDILQNELKSVTETTKISEKKNRAPIRKEDMTVLVIDDQEMVRRVTQSMLMRIGFNVVTARDGQEAIEIYKKNQKAIGLVLSDLSMPGMNGWETMAALKKIDPDVPIILASGYDESHVLNINHGESPHAFIKKPYTRKQLEETVSMIFPKSQ